ncbi:GNAT family N-acetyltransferase [Mycobacterium sp. 48b]|uniref:GNAT family N-acetyltransferase n=1 Tax=Mycobacterium sp. 48b TaxID=3400426 RepID=UPI003AAA4C35
MTGRGYATEASRALLRCAAGQLADQPVVIVTQSANLAALRLADRLGFSRLGTSDGGRSCRSGTFSTVATALWDRAHG